MNANRARSAMKSVIAVLIAACFLTMTLGTASRAVAAEDWPVWPKKTTEPGVEAPPPPPPQAQPVGAAKEGSEAGQAVKEGTSAGTIGWIAAGVAAAIGIGIAAGGGGGGGTSAPACNE